MAHSRENHFNPSSPRSSSGGAESFRGTPDTRLTTFSPEESSTKLRMYPNPPTNSGSSTPLVIQPMNYRDTSSHTDKDPFITPTYEVPASNLSPMASAFNPFAKPVQHSLPGASAVISMALSTDLGISRHLDISTLATISTSEVEAWLATLEANGAHLHGDRQLGAMNDHVFVYFTDIRDACSVHASIRLMEKNWTVDYIGTSQMSKDILMLFDQTSAQAGQVSIFASIPAGCVADGIWAIESARSALAAHGDIFAIARRSTFPDGSFKAIVEFCDVSVAAIASASSNNTLTAEDIHLTVTARNGDSDYGYDIGQALQDLAIAKAHDDLDCQPNCVKPVNPRSMPGPQLRVQPSVAVYPFMFPSPLAPNMPYVLDRYLPNGHSNTVGSMATYAHVPPSYPVVGPLYQTPPSPALTASHNFSPSKALSVSGRSDMRRHNAARINRTPYHNAVGHHNHVDTSRIREGTDVRTTIMLRNIPNKVDQAMLKRIIDESSWGKYDFMYLRIDFANDCNVGYAFINFVDPLDIIDFVEARGNQRWNCFKSDKVAEISYATIQGKDCLVQKFRNSSVMLEAPHYRPKLYFTSNGPMPELAGQEEPFPDPDNQSKMKRSCENAEHVGLFTPNAGQHFRDEQRRRRSQYDRGTRLAALEEYDYEAAIQHLYTAASQ
ncbi:hypothetical protein S7711_04528 [Stachybotrys chartarum IBT 7711]|uniref:RRM domain-containing protein n=1 Tax=Stachybotrys chartarum (strain CBS 109288 / IBT 7711) TaxID=1280523 RepID=A0A084APP6_STACB|nr:hypothetical protein S7711_04528 [Stachybotrys chartarum IBT 7711]KFA75316.1 hypothetical protein S40288_00205 [Stachybotrys chartarum IBT 40288]